MLFRERLRGGNLLYVDDRGLRDDRDLARELAEFQVDVNLRDPVHAHLDVRAPLRQEALELHVDRVDAGRQTREVESATAVAEHGSLPHEGRRSEADRGPRQRSVVLVLHMAGKPARDLGQDRRGQQGRADEQDQHERQATGHRHGGAPFRDAFLNAGAGSGRLPHKTKA